MNRSIRISEGSKTRIQKGKKKVKSNKIAEDSCDARLTRALMSWLARGDKTRKKTGDGARKPRRTN